MSTFNLDTDSHDHLANAAIKPPQYRVYSQEQAFSHMTRQRSEKHQLLYLIVDDVLFNIWDSYCLSIDQQYREEYLPYLPHVFDLLCATEDGMDIFDYLVYVEENELGTFKGDMLSRRRAARVVEILLDHKETIFGENLEERLVKKDPETDEPEFYPA